MLHFDINLMASYETHAWIPVTSDLWNFRDVMEALTSTFQMSKVSMSTVEVQTLCRSMKAKKSHCRCHLRSDFWTFVLYSNDNPQSDLLQGPKPESMANQNGLT